VNFVNKCFETLTWLHYPVPGRFSDNARQFSAYFPYF
jgi:hypothetical protein